MTLIEPVTNITFANYAAAREYLEPFAHLPGLATAPDVALQRTKALMDALGNLQDAIPVIHLAGTSGKGSTATILAALLQAHGLHVGLGLSPHVRHLLERIQIDGAPVHEADFCRALGEMVPVITAMQQSEWGAPSFFEISIALSYKLFAEAGGAGNDGKNDGIKGVDVVVMETGLGGRHDATNTVTRQDKIALFTDIGYDHVDILGTTLGKIAAQKAGIIQPQNRVLTYLQPAEAQDVIVAECAEQNAQLAIFDPAASIDTINLFPAHVVFDLALPNYAPLHALHLSLTGTHQAENAGLAIAAAQLFLDGLGRSLDERALRHALARITLPGRMDRREWREARFIIDGAHNAQKMHALCSALQGLYPDQRFVFVVALKEGKDHRAIFAQLLPLAAHLILTRFDNQDQGMPLQATDPTALETQIATQLDDAHVSVTVEPNVAAALARAVTVAQRAPHATPNAAPIPIVVTGSLYMLAEVYEVLDA